VIATFRNRRVVAAIACLVASLALNIPAYGATGDDDARIVSLLNGNSCADRSGDPPEGSVYVAQFVQPTPTPNPFATPTPTPNPFATPTPTPNPFATPSFAPFSSGATTLYATPRPYGSPGVTPPPVPSAVTPAPFDQNQPILIQRGGNTPPPIAPAGESTPTPTPSPSPSGSPQASASPTTAPTLKPNYVAILADKVSGAAAIGQPGDADGNVHMLYGAEEIVGDHAHYDGRRTVTITGHPFIINHAKDTVLIADKIEFDTISQSAKLTNGRGTSSEGVERGLVHFQATDLHTDASGVGHGLAPNVSTCENERSGYHMTGKSMDVYPGDKIVIYKAILWLGAAAVFWLPKVVIPLRQVDDETQRPKYFPDVGYDQIEGYWIKTRVTFGRNQYYYGYYVVNYFTKEGLGLGYVAFYTKHSGHRQASINFYTINDRLAGARENNIQLTETENFSQALRGNFNLDYTSNYGPYNDVPANTSFTSQIAHQTLHTSQTYGFSRSDVGSESSSNAFSFTDNRQFSTAVSNALSFNLSSDNSNFAGVGSSNATAHVTDLYHFTTAGADYQLTYDKTLAQQPYGINKEPELQIRPNHFLQHLFFPSSATFTVGEYNEPSTPETTQRADMAFVFGPLDEKIAASDFQGTLSVNQYAYGTGDLKASIQQTATLTSPLGNHFVNTLSYNEANFNGPAEVPFDTLDTQPTENTKNAQDLVRLFNAATYNLALGFSTNFDEQAQPVTYQLTVQPSSRSVVQLNGTFDPGPGNGFFTTNVQFATPFGRDASVQFLGDVNWKLGSRIENKIVYYTRTIGNCYQLQALYNESIKLVTFSISILSFPSKTATFNVGQPGSIVPGTFNAF